VICLFFKYAIHEEPLPGVIFLFFKHAIHEEQFPGVIFLFFKYAIHEEPFPGTKKSKKRLGDPKRAEPVSSWNPGT
jgi:hypothetical protein